MGECQPKVIPTRLLRWLYTWRPRSGALSRLFRRAVVRPVNQAYVRLSPAIIRAVPVPHRLSPRRFELEMRRFVDIVRKERQALVLLIGANPAGDKLEATLPGTDERARRFNAIVERVASDGGDDVRYIDAYALVRREGFDEVLPDGIHFNVRGHRLIGELLADEIKRWLKAREAAGEG